MEKHIATFAAHDVDFPMFLTLTEEDLQELGLSLGNRRKLSMVIAELRERDRQQRYLQSPVAHPHYQRAASPFQAYPPASDWAHSPFVSSPMSYAFGERARSPITGFGPGASPISIGGFDVFRGGIPYGSIHPTMTTGQIQGTEKQGPSSPLGVASTSTAYHLPVPRAFEGQRQQQSTKMHHDNDTKR